MVVGLHQNLGESDSVPIDSIALAKHDEDRRLARPSSAFRRVSTLKNWCGLLLHRLASNPVVLLLEPQGAPYRDDDSQPQEDDIRCKLHVTWPSVGRPGGIGAPVRTRPGG